MYYNISDRENIDIGTKGKEKNEDLVLAQRNTQDKDKVTIDRTEIENLSLRRTLPRKILIINHVLWL